MKTFISAIVTLTFVSHSAWAGKATLKVKDLDTSDDGETAIVIRKGPNAGLPSPTPPQWEIVEDSEEIEGDAAAGSQEAMANWKTACADWKKEFKELNKENKILVMNCGKATSTLQPNGQRVYSSTAKYKMKTLINPGDPRALEPKGESKSEPKPTVTVTATPAAPAAPAAPATPAPAATE